MDHGLPACPRSPVHHLSPRFFPESGSVSLRESAPALSRPLSLDNHQGRSPLPQLMRHSCLRIWNHPAPPCCPQGHRDLPPFLPLEFSGLHSQLRHVYETFQVSKTGCHQPKLRRTHQLSSHSRRHRSVPDDLLITPPTRDRLHARRSHVLHPSSNRRSFRTLPSAQQAPLQPRCPSREQLHGSLSLPNHLHIPTKLEQPPLHPRRASRRKLRPTSVRHPVVEAPTHHQPLLQPVRDHSGILGPCPLDSHSTWASDQRFSRAPARILQGAPGPSAARSHVSQPTSPPSDGPFRGVRRPVHVHSSRPHPPNLRSSRLRQDPFKQAEARLGHSPSVGQPSNLRPPKRAGTPKSGVQLLPLPHSEGPSLLGPAPQPLPGTSASILGPRPPCLEGAHHWLTSPQGIVPSSCSSSTGRAPPRALSHSSPHSPPNRCVLSAESLLFGTLPKNSVPQQVLPVRLSATVGLPLGAPTIHTPPPIVASCAADLHDPSDGLSNSHPRAAAVGPKPSRRLSHTPSPLRVQPELAAGILPRAHSSELSAPGHGFQPEPAPNSLRGTSLRHQLSPSTSPRAPHRKPRSESAPRASSPDATDKPASSSELFRSPGALVVPEPPLRDLEPPLSALSFSFPKFPASSRASTSPV
ncbi:movement protein MP [Diascia yellow mottle virus]|uniref:movement protein MP n=1 Tax=Diascia yellow mottle virus TaxID=547467 RepID=UPI000179A664|nr:movement protein MP [Diascia yellow mottle virus]ACF40326.1 movement protein MP [Diascia yellow mottle virus]